MINQAKPSTALVNIDKVLDYDTWDTITTTWATESRTWDETLSTWTGTSKPSNTITNITKP